MAAAGEAEAAAEEAWRSGHSLGSAVPSAPEDQEPNPSPRVRAILPPPTPNSNHLEKPLQKHRKLWFGFNSDSHCKIQSPVPLLTT